LLATSVAAYPSRVLKLSRLQIVSTVFAAITSVAGAATCPVPAACDAADALCVIPQSPTTAIVSWQPVAGAVDYVLIRNSVQLIRAEESQIKFRSIDITPGATYNYQLAAINASGATIKTMSFSATQPSGIADLTANDAAPAGSTLSRAMTTFGWTPLQPYDTCSKALHDAFWTYGPDNKIYPTWHPPVYEFADGSTCTFGHEHGQDQRQSNLYGTTGPLPFAYVNEQLSPTDPNFQRNEDHVGHKVALFNGLFTPDDATLTNRPPICDVLFKLHQGSHSPDALKNNTHERFLHYRCFDDLNRTQRNMEVHWKSLQPFGSPNSFQIEAANQFSQLIVTAGASPANQPSGENRRQIPAPQTMQATINANGGATDRDSFCDNCNSIATWNSESWQGGPQLILVKPVNGVDQVAFQFSAGPYWNLQSSSRYYDPAGNTDPANSQYLMSRQIDLCYIAGSVVYTAADCKLARSRNGGARIAWNSPLSPFAGTKRFNEGNFVLLRNPDPINQRLFFTPYGGMSYANGNFQRTRSVQHPIRNDFSVTAADGVGNKLSNFAGSAQCGGGSCWTDFNRYRLKSGTTVDAGVHAPN
jgi:hypothetical protein